jgi:hypothetical protein
MRAELSRMELVSYKKGTFHCLRMKQKGANFEAQSMPSPNIEYAGTLILDFLTSEM